MVNRKAGRKFHLQPRGNRQRPHVLLIVETAMSFGRGVLEGISQYLVENPPWSVQLDLRELLVTPPAWLENWDGDGIITPFEFVDKFKKIAMEQPLHPSAFARVPSTNPSALQVGPASRIRTAPPAVCAHSPRPSPTSL